MPAEDEHSSLFVLLVSFKENKQITLIPGVNVAKQFIFVIDAQPIKLECLSLAGSLICRVKGGMEHLTLILSHKYKTRQKIIPIDIHCRLFILRPILEYPLT